MRAFLPLDLPLHFSELKIPLGVMTTDFYGKLECEIDSGELFSALAATAALGLGIIGTLMLIESVGALMRSRRMAAPKRKKHNWVHNLPIKSKFRTSGLYISVIPPVLVGFGVGVLSAIMGVGGGFIMVPAMIYILGMPTKVVVGTSLFQIIFVAAFTTLMHAWENHTVDIGLAVLLIVGGVIGAQVGARIGLRIKAEQTRILLALLVVGVCLNLAVGLLVEPKELYSIGTEG